MPNRNDRESQPLRWQPSASLSQLHTRARLLQSIRAFFASRHVLEVDTPVLSLSANTDPQLESFRTTFNNKTYYLNTSPEFYMKRLLAAGSGDIYQLAKVFRVDEQGACHNPEFTLLEWYRTGMDHHQLMDEMQQLVSSLYTGVGADVGDAPEFEKISYQQAFQTELMIDPLSANAEQLLNCAQQNDVEVPVGLEMNDRDMWLDWLMVARIAPSFNPQAFTFIYDYPASQAALARLNPQDKRVAHRFELYYGELELANGFYELSDASEQAARFEQENKTRSQQGKTVLPVDSALLAALDSGLPDCAGVALGIERLMMLLTKAQKISDVMSFITE